MHCIVQCVRNIPVYKDEFYDHVIAKSIRFSTSNNLFLFFWMSHLVFSRSHNLA